MPGRKMAPQEKEIRNLLNQSNNPREINILGDYFSF